MFISCRTLHSVGGGGGEQRLAEVNLYTCRISWFESHLCKVFHKF